jgi:polyhydroxybutyrate depolymerase
VIFQYNCCHRAKAVPSLLHPNSRRAIRETRRRGAAVKKSSGLLFFTILILLSGLTACGRAAAPPTATPEPSAAPTETATATATATPGLPPGDYNRTVESGGVQRSYLLHVPKGFDSRAPVPVVFVFHGWSGLPEDMVGTTDFNAIADREGFLAVYPRGSGTGNGDLSWNAGICCGYALDRKVDDVAFVRRMLEDLASFAAPDPQRIYATGFSNGAFLSYRLACEMSDAFAAVAPVGGVLVLADCRPRQPVAVIHIHGLIDVSVPYEGGGDLISGGFPSVEESIQTWVALDGCSGAPVTDAPYKNVVHTAYDSCRAGTAVELYAINYFGHRWPLANTMPASETIWKFFAAHPKA